MKREHPPKKEKYPFLPLFCIHIDKEIEEDLLNTAIEHHQKIPGQPGAGKMFRDALQAHIRDSNFPHIIRAPKPRLLMILKEQWLEKVDFYLLVIWLWKNLNEVSLRDVSKWLSENQPEGQRIYADDFETPAGIDSLLTDWAQSYESLGQNQARTKFTMALSLYEAQHPDTFQKFESGEQIPPVKKIKQEAGHMTQIENNPWKNMLKQLEREKPGRITMPEFDEFVEQAREIVRCKVDEWQQSQKREALSGRLRELWGIIGQWETYFEFHRHHDWSADHLSLEDEKVVLEKSKELQESLAEWEDMRKVQAAKREERREQERKLSDAEDEILGLYRELDLLMNPRNEAGAPDEIKSEPQAELNAGASLDVQSSVPGEQAQSERDSGSTSDSPASMEQPSGLETQTSTEPPNSDLESGSGNVPEIEISGTLLPEEPALEAPAEEVSEPVAEALPLPEDETSLESETAVLEEEEALVESEIPAEADFPDYGSVSDQEIEQSLVHSFTRQDFAHAYWVARAAEQQGRSPYLPAWLIGGLQGMQWWLVTGASTSARLLNEIRDISNPQEHTLEAAHSVPGLSMAVGLGLLDGGSGWDAWLDADIPSRAPEIDRLLNEIDQFARTGIKLDPSLVRGILGREELEANTRKTAAKAKEWLATAPQKGTRFPGADDVWKAIVGSKGTLHVWFDCVARDQRKSLEKVRKELEHWDDRTWLDNYIQKLNREKHNGARTIDGGARDQLISWLQNAADLAHEWVRNVSAASRIADKKNWNWDQTTSLCDFLKNNLPKSIQEAQILQSSADDPWDQIGFRILGATLDLLQASLGLRPGVDQGSSALYQDTLSLEENLATSLIIFPELPLKKNGLPSRQFAAKDLSALVKAQHSPAEAFDMWLRRKNYWFVDDLIGRMSGSEQDLARQRMFDQLAVDAQEVLQELDKATVAIEQAMLDGLISDQDSVIPRSRVASIHKQIRGSASGGESSERMNFQEYLEELRAIRRDFETSRDERLGKSRRHWEELLSRVSVFIPDDNERDQVVNLVNRGFEHKDLRAVSEAIAHLESVATGNEKLAWSLFSHQEVSYKVKEFDRVIRQMDKSLEWRSLVEVGESRMHNLPAGRVTEVRAGLEAWSRLKREVNRNLREEIFPPLSSVLQYLGWDLNPDSPISIAGPVPAGFQHWHISAAPRVLSPVPQYGSDRLKGKSSSTGMYDVVGAWGRPSFDAIESLISEMGREPFLLLYFGRMLPSQRMDLMKLARKKQHPLVAVDDLLMAFLAGEYNVRLSAMFDCALPYSSVNPYTPFATGSVPPEMFFGREDKIAALEDQYGPSIVYGGRQLGKSALLRQVQRKFHKPERGQFAIYEDIKTIGDPLSEKDYSTLLSERLVTAFRNEHIVDASRQALDMEKLSDVLIHQIKSKGWRVLLLLDETDLFLEADASRRFHAVTMLKRVMDQTDRMFKVVFAGLHQVQRFTRTSNQPLAHLGSSDAIRIGPMEPLAAIELIEKPLRALGYMFGKPGNEDKSLIAHILSYTNYHPRLLQLFGQSLADHLHKKFHGSAAPPYSISRSDIEAVYRTARVRADIKECFDITLGLDERFAAITLSLIIEQWDEKNGFDRLFTPEELLRVTRGYWSAGFEDDITIFKGLLDEMCGLGVLSGVSLGNTDSDNEQGHGDGGHYRLRSPNLVSLMGSYEEILNRLVLISKSQPESMQRKLESYHAPIESYYSPLTYAQERVLLGGSSGVCMVFGAQATRINNLPAILKATSERVGCWEEIKVAANSEATLLDQLRSLPRNPDRPTIAYRELGGTPQQMQQQIIAAARFCGQPRTGRLRVIFSLDSLTAWNWFQLPSVERLKVEQDYVDVLVSLGRWDPLGIRQLLEQHDPEIQVGKSVIRRVFDVTGGWPNLMDEFIDRCRGKTDPLPALETLRDELSGETARIRFIEDLGLYDNQILNHYIDSVLAEKDLGSFPMEDALDYLFANNPEQARDITEYLHRMSIVLREPTLKIEPVVAKLWHGPRT